MEEIRCCFNKRNLDGIEDNGTLIIIDENSNAGFNFPIGLFIPDDINDEVDLILTGLTPDSIKSDNINDAITDVKTMWKNRQLSPIYRELSTKYKNVMMVPLIPRPDGFYAGYYGKTIRDNDFSNAIRYIDMGYSKLKKEDLTLFKDIDSQIVNMIKYVKQFLKDRNITVDDKIITCGYSASSKFANCFAALHNDLVKTVIAGGTTGLGILPLREYHGYKLEYPIGIADVPEFDIDKFKEIKQFYFIGTEDINDPAQANCEKAIIGYDDNGKPIYQRDPNGNVMPARYDDGSIRYIYTKDGMLSPRCDTGYSNEQITIIHKELSANIQERFKKQKEIYESFGIDATMVQIPGNHITVSDYEELNNMIFDFYEQTKLNKTL